MPDLHVRLLRQVARIRRRQLRDAQDAPTGQDAATRVQDAENLQSRADARLAATVARRRLESEHDDDAGSS